MTITKLPVGNVASQSLNFAWSNFGTLLRIGWFPLLASAIFSAVANFPSLANDAAGTTVGGYAIVVLLAGIGATVLWAMFAVAVHRMILLDEPASDEWFYLRFTGQEIRYAIAPFLIGLIPILVLIGVVVLFFGADVISVPESRADTPAIQLLGLFLGIALFVYVAVRLILVMPIIVAEGKIGIRRAWSISKGNFWRLIGAHLLMGMAIIIFVLVFGLLAAFGVYIGSSVGFPIMPIGGGLPAIALTVLGGIISYLFLAFFGTVASLAVLSYSYKALSESDA